MPKFQPDEFLILKHKNNWNVVSILRIIGYYGRDGYYRGYEVKNKAGVPVLTQLSIRRVEEIFRLATEAEVLLYG